MNLTFLENAWCFLFSTPDLKNGGRHLPGVKDTYGRSDPETGAYYLYLTDGRRAGQYVVSRDCEMSHVYSERVFVYGEDEHGVSVSDPEVLREKLKVMGFNCVHQWEHVILHRGWAQGATTWRHALRAHTDYGPRWYDVLTRLDKLEPPWQVVPTPGLQAADVYCPDSELPATP